VGALGLRRVEVRGAVVDVHVVDGVVAEVAPRIVFPRKEEVVDGGGGALLPGLHDHHVHLLAMAAARRSVRVGPPEVLDHEGLVAALRAADEALPPDAWLRAVGYHESVDGDLDRVRLDEIVARRPVRVQHRSGALWLLNTAALRAIGEGGEGDGRLFGADGWLRDRLPPDDAPDLAAIGTELSGYGVTGVTDATPVDRREDLEVLAGACARGDLPQDVQVTGGPALAGCEVPSGLRRGPVKVLLADHRLPPLDEVVAWFRDAHRLGRPVAVHCVTREALILALAAWEAAGARPGDRVEHAAIADGPLARRVSSLGLTVVTQPGFIAERGDRYLVEVEPADRPHLWPCRTLLEAGVAVAASTDAPFGHPDPWRAVAAATTRRTAAGQPLGAEEAVDARTALALLLGTLTDPGGPTRRVRPGARADLCLLDLPLDDALAHPSAELVALTLQAGEVVHRRTP
jgi:predicted amidohydrolase YtcJ